MESDFWHIFPLPLVPGSGGPGETTVQSAARRMRKPVLLLLLLWSVSVQTSTANVNISPETTTWRKAYETQHHVTAVFADDETMFAHSGRSHSMPEERPDTVGSAAETSNPDHDQTHTPNIPANSEISEYDEHDEEGGIIGYIGRYHPVAVHFPVALIITSFLVSIMATIRPTRGYDIFSVKLIYVAAIAAAVAAAMGLATARGANYGREMHWYFVNHRLLGLTTTGLSFVTAVVGRVYEIKAKRSVWRLFCGLLLVSSILVAVAGHLGAILVHGPDHFSL